MQPRPPRAILYPPPSVLVFLFPSVSSVCSVVQRFPVPGNRDAFYTAQGTRGEEVIA